MFLESKVRLVCGADNLTAIYEPRLSTQILNISELYRPPRPVMGIALLFFFSFTARMKLSTNKWASGFPLKQEF
jgi:hypothetical protein